MSIRRISHAVPPLRVVTAMAALVALLLGLVAVADRAGADTTLIVNVTPGTDLPAQDAEVTVSGTGFSGDGIYVALGPAGLWAIDGWNMDTSLFHSDQKRVTSFTDGAFTQDLKLDAVFTSGDVEVDCREVECGVYTWRDHTGFGDRSQDTYTPVTFHAGPSVTVSPDSELPVEDAEVTVSGTGFSGDGIYVALGPADVKDTVDWNKKANLFTGAQSVTAFTDGAFSRVLTFDAVFMSGETEVDCREVECGIFTWRNHTGFDDRSQDTYTPVSFATEADGPSVTVDPSSDLPAENAVVTVSGTGFSGDGIYVALGPADVKDTVDWNKKPNLFTGAGSVSTFTDGAFSRVLTFDAVFMSGETEVDCREVECGIFTWRNHTGFDDRSQDTYTPVSFATDEGPNDPNDPNDPTDPVDPITIEGGYLDWGVKQSFRNYIANIAHGTITVGDGAAQNADGTFRFPVEASAGDVAADGSLVVADFGGSVRFTAHDGALDLLIEDIVVTMEGDAGVLEADVVSKDLETSEVLVLPGLELAVLDLSGVSPSVAATTVTWADIASALTEAGVPAFSDFYAAGDPLDPATVVLQLSEVPDLPGGGGGKPDASVASIDRTTVSPGESMTVSGFGFTPGEQVEVLLFSDPAWVGTTVATEEGTASLTFVVPLDTPAGFHHLEMRGITSSHVASSPQFEVLASAVTPSGSLPYTGGDVLPLAGMAVLLLGAGAVVVLTTRRTRTAPR